MSNPAQKRAIKNYRRRLQKRGAARFEVLGLNADRELIRSLARKLAQDDAEAKRIRSEVTRAVSGIPPKWMGEQTDDSLFILSLSLAEIWRGILEKPAGKKRRELEAWFSGPEGPQALFRGLVP